MKRILFLDDDPARRRWAKRELGPGNTLWVTDHAGGAIGVLSLPAPFHHYDEVYLDHDLDGEGGTNLDPGRADTGSEVVRWIVANRPPIGRIIVHSLSRHAGAMVADLRDAGYDAEAVSILRLAARAMGGRQAKPPGLSTYEGPQVDNQNPL